VGAGLCIVDTYSMLNKPLFERVILNDTWKDILSSEFEDAYFEKLVTFLKVEKSKGASIFPPGGEIFAALNAIDFTGVKVVILGQDPYHGAGQANGFCFSVTDGVQHPPSLINIFKELETDLGMNYPSSGNLSAWAKQGVLLLNSILSVEAHRPGSHQGRGWEVFTDAIIQLLSQEREHLVFMLWGGYAKKKGNIIDPSRHCILKSGHPSPLSANRGYWFGNKHFSKANTYLESNGIAPINWELDVEAN
jgi:uracil-DNA glycosylase